MVTMLGNISVLHTRLETGTHRGSLASLSSQNFVSLCGNTLVDVFVQTFKE